MSVKLRFEKGSLVTQVVLKDGALLGLNKIVSEFQSDEAVSAAPFHSIGDPSPNQPGDPSGTVKEWLKSHGAAESLNLIDWKTGPEKILLLGAFHESRGKANESWRSADMETRFTEANEAFPKNFPRDIKTAVKSGFIATITPRTYNVSRTGWNKLAAAIAKTIPSESL
ncbi:MAG: hypothetical protein ACLPYZ_14785 [Limisphaerales bacterium]